MLNVMREIKGHWAVKAVLYLTAASMVLYLGYYFTDDSASAGPAGEWAAKVGDRRIGVREFQRTAQNLDNQYRSMLGEQYEQFKSQIALGQQAVGQLISREIILLEAEQMGIAASKKEIADAVVESDTFKDASGNFIGKERYLEALARYPGGPAAYEAALAQDIVVDKFRDLATESAFVTDRELEDEFRASTVRTAVDYVLVRAADQDVATSVEDAELRAYYDANADDYLRDERRQIRYLLIPRQAMLEKVEITDEAIQAFHTENLDAYRHPEQRRARHILFRVGADDGETGDRAARSEAEATIRRIEGGSDFAELAASVSQDEGTKTRGGDLGWFGRGQMVPAFDAAVFDGEPGTLVSEPVKTGFGYHVIEILGARDEGVLPVEEARDDIRRQLAAREAQSLLISEADRVAGRIASPADLETVAAEEGFEVTSATFGDSDRLPALAPSPEFRDTVAGLAAGEVSPPLGVARGLAIVTVDEVVPAAVAPFEEVRDQVRSAVVNQRSREASVAAARRALERRGGFDAAAKALDAEIRESGDLAPGPVSLPGTGGGQEALQAELFGADVAEDATGVVEVPAGAVLYRVSRHVPFDPVMFDASRDSLRERLLEQKRSELFDAIVRRLQNRFPVEVNQEIVSRYDG